MIVNVSDGVDYELIHFKLNVEKGAEESSSMLSIIIAVIMILLVLVAVVIFFVTRKKKNEEEKGMTTGELMDYIHDQIGELEKEDQEE